MNKQNFPPGPKNHFPLEQLLALQRDPTGFLSHLAQTYGDVSHFTMAGEHFYLLSHPDLVKEVLVTRHREFVKGRGHRLTKRLLGEGLLTSDGELHLRQRRMIQPMFDHEHIARYAEVMGGFATRQSANWNDGQGLDIYREMRQLLLLIIAKTLFNTEVQAEAEELNRAIDALTAMFHPLIIVFGEALLKFPNPWRARYQRSRARLDATIYRLIGEHRARGGTSDLLSMLLRAEDDEDEGRRMDEMQVRDEAITFFTAAHGTTAIGLTWTWYLLSQNPDVEIRLHAELDRVLEGRIPTFGDLPNLRYTRMVFAEALRLYPPVYATEREPIHDLELGNYFVPVGATILLSQWVTHHDARLYPEPFRFDPLRWTPENQADRPKLAYFPFGAGPRVCIGEDFAWMDGTLILATLAQSWRLRLAPNARVQLNPLFGLEPKYGVPMIVERRKGAQA